jgi:heat shock protein HslJ
VERSIRRQPDAAALLAGLLALSTAVSAAEDSGGTPGLEGIDWRLLQYRAGEVMHDAVGGEQTTAVLRFDEGRMSGSGGCNRLMGAYRLDGNKLSFEPRVASTMMACPAPQMEQESALVDAIGRAASFAIEGKELRVSDANGIAVLTFVKREDRALTGTSWRLTRYNNGKQAIVTVLPDTEIMLLLRDDGQLAGKACNSYRGGFQRSGATLRLVGPIAATRMACPGAEAASAQEAAYFAALERVAGYRISGNELTLTDEHDTTLASFRADSPAP